MGVLVAMASSAYAEKKPTRLRYTGELEAACGTAVTVAAHIEPVVYGATIVFTLNGTDSCSGQVDGNGIVSCGLAPSLPAGTYPLAVEFAGDSQYGPSSETVDFTVSTNTASLDYIGATSSPFSVSAQAAARLSPAVPGAALTFTLDNAETCTAIADAAGVASCALTPGEAAGTYPLVVTFAGNTCHTSASLTVPFAVTKLPTAVVYTGATSSQVGETVTASATLSPAVAGATLVFQLATGESCSAVIDAAGGASCPITPHTSGVHTITASYAGNDRYLPASDAAPFTVIALPVSVSLQYTGELVVANAEPALLAGVLRDGATPIAGRTVSFVLGAGGSAQSCQSVTNAAGIASCTIAAVAQPLNAAATLPIASAFAGDAAYLPASDADTARLQYMTGAGYRLRGSIALPLTGTVNLPSVVITGNVRTPDASTTTLGCTPFLRFVASGLDVVRMHDICANVTTTVAPGSSTTTSSMTKAEVNLLGLLPAIEIVGPHASAHSTCSGATGSAGVTGIKLGGISLAVSSAPNTVIPLPLNGKIIINEQVPTPGVSHGLTVNAVRIVVPPVLGLAGVNLTVVSAVSAIDNCRPAQVLQIGESQDVAFAAPALDEPGGCSTSRPGGALGLATLAAAAILVRRRRRAQAAA